MPSPPHMVLLLTAIVVLLSGCSGLCSNTVQQRIASLDGKLEAVAFIRDCGATTTASAQISIVDQDERVSGTGNALTTELVGAGDGLGVRWLGPDHVEISLPPDAEVFRRNEAVSGVRITYRGQEQP